MPGLDKEGILERTNGPIKDLNIDDRTFVIYLIDSNQMDTTMPGKYDIVQDTLTKKEVKVDGFDIVKEQEKDEILLYLKVRLQKGDVTSADYSRHVDLMSHFTTFLMKMMSLQSGPTYLIT